MSFKYNPNQEFQLKAVSNVIGIFEGVGEYHLSDKAPSSEIVPNIPEDDDLDEDFLLENLQYVQEGFDHEMIARGTPTMKIGVSNSLKKERGQMLEGVSNDIYEYPSFSIEMETGTGKTYVYLKTIYELYQKYGFSKYIIVVPSIAIYEGVKSSFKDTKSHFQSIYGNDQAVLRPYNSKRIQDVKYFANSKDVEILLITLAAFNSSSNNLYKSQEPTRDLLPYEYIQNTRPILILDEPQNMNSARSKDALRTLKPLFSLRYSATHKEKHNLVYRLTPVEAFRRNLVKRIQVVGVEQEELGGKVPMSLKKVTGSGKSAKATIVTYSEKDGKQVLDEVILKTGNHLFDKTKIPDHQGFRVHNIGSAKGEEFISFENEITLNIYGGDGISKPDIFRYQIKETIDQHIDHQKKVKAKGVKVLSLLFIDKVSNYIGNGKDIGIIQKIFTEEFNKAKGRLDLFRDKSAEEVQASYFASYRYKPKGGEEQTIYLESEATNKKQREAEKKQFKLIMQGKEDLVKFNNSDVCFIFAHSALKEGWDNPNVFQICTLNQTLSKDKKRQEIGRGLRLAVNQKLERVHDEQVNILTVVANESYESFANTLQKEYRDEEGEAPKKPTPKKGIPSKRQEKFYFSDDFKSFWEKLSRRSEYKINVNTDLLLTQIKERFKEPRNKFPVPKVVITKGHFVMTSFNFKIVSIKKDSVSLSIIKEDTRGNRNNLGGNLIEGSIEIHEGDNLERILKEKKLRGFVVNSIRAGKSNPDVVFKNGFKISLFKPETFEVSDNSDIKTKDSKSSLQKYPVSNIVDKLEKATSLTKDTCFRILKGVPFEEQSKIFQNPEGFTNKLIEITKNALAEHVAENIQFELTDDFQDRDIEDLFPPSLQHVQTEIVPSPKHGLYDSTQKDSDIEEKFVSSKLETDENIAFFFKFPSKYKIDFPKIIGNYNPDWGIIRKNSNGIKVQLVRETKGSADIEKLRFAHEIRKVKVAEKHFQALGINYDIIKGDEPKWYEKNKINRSPSKLI